MIRKPLIATAILFLCSIVISYGTGYGISYAAATGCPTGFEAFKKTMYPLLRQKCIACHENGPGPSHSVADPEVSYKAILAYTDFSHLEKSMIYTKGGSQHCADYGVECGVDYARIKQTVNQWWQQGESKCGEQRQNESTLSATRDVAISLKQLQASAGGYIPLRWSLDHLGGTFKGVSFEMQIQLFSNKNAISYRLRSPRFVAPSGKAIHVSGLDLYLNGLFVEEANEFSTIAIDGALGSVISTNLAIVLADKPDHDVLMIKFRDLGFAKPPTCNALELFKANPTNFMNARRCLACHATGTSWRMSNNPEELCRQTKSRIDMLAPGASPFFRYACQKFGGHPNVCQNPAEGYFYLNAWIDAEGKSR